MYWGTDTDGQIIFWPTATSVSTGAWSYTSISFSSDFPVQRQKEDNSFEAALRKLAKSQDKALRMFAQRRLLVDVVGDPPPPPAPRKALQARHGYSRAPRLPGYRNGR